MRQYAVVFLAMLIGLLGFMVYCTAVIDWVQDFRRDAYTHNLPEALVETTAIILYTVLAIRFARQKVNFY